MKKVCAWCEAEMEMGPLEDDPEEIITHSICALCLEKLLGPQEVAWGEFLESLKVPVVLVNAAGNAENANEAARVLMQKELPEIVGFAGGVVFECAYAAYPEGCGNTVHCSGCAIRNTVMETFQSGKGHLDVQASLLCGTPDSNQEVEILISTEKVGDVVLLKVEKTGDA